MADRKTADRKTAPRENLPSVVARKAQLFERDAPVGPVIVRKPFADYLREIPAAPLPLGLKAALWATGILVGLILAFALVRGPKPKKPKPAATSGIPAGSRPAVGLDSMIGQSLGIDNNRQASSGAGLWMHPPYPGLIVGWIVNLPSPALSSAISRP